MNPESSGESAETAFGGLVEAQNNLYVLLHELEKTRETGNRLFTPKRVNQHRQNPDSFDRL